MPLRPLNIFAPLAMAHVLIAYIVTALCSCELYSHALYSHGLWNHGLYTYGLYSYGLSGSDKRLSTRGGQRRWSGGSPRRRPERSHFFFDKRSGHARRRTPRGRAGLGGTRLSTCFFRSTRALGAHRRRPPTLSKKMKEPRAADSALQRRQAAAARVRVLEMEAQAEANTEARQRNMPACLPTRTRQLARSTHTSTRDGDSIFGHSAPFPMLPSDSIQPSAFAVGMPRKVAKKKLPSLHVRRTHQHAC